MKVFVALAFLTTFFEGFAEDEFVESATLEDFVDALKFEAIGQIVGAGTFRHFRDWTKRQGMAV